MEKLVTTQELETLELPLPDNVLVVCFKMVSYGPKILEDTGRIGSKICDFAAQQPAFFIISDSSDGIRQSMHDLVDRFCNAREGKV